MFLNSKIGVYLVIFLVLHSFNEGVLSYRVVCVYTNWSQYRPDKGKFLPENVDPSLCTHLIYVYAKLKGNQLEPSEWNDDPTPWMEGMYSRVNNLKQLNPDLKTLLGVGGWNMGSKEFSRLASRTKFREIFARTAVTFLRDRDFDGLAIDWQYPTQRGGRRTDRRNFSLLLKEIQKAFDAESTESGLPKLLLAAGVSAVKSVIDSAYEVEKVSNYTDFLNVMAYDLHGSWDNFTGHPSPLFPRKDEIGPQAEINADSSLQHWISKGAEPSKLVLGVSTYGRTFTLYNKTKNGYRALSKSPGNAGDYTKQAGMLAFYERCSLYYDATRVWDDYSKVPYWYSGTQWIGGEDTKSIREKVNWIHSNGLGGMMFWSLDTDDFNGSFCGEVSFPLVHAAVDQFAAPSPVVRPLTVQKPDKQTSEKLTPKSKVIPRKKNLDKKDDQKRKSVNVKSKKKPSHITKPTNRDHKLGKKTNMMISKSSVLNNMKYIDLKEKKKTNITSLTKNTQTASATSGKAISDISDNSRINKSEENSKKDSSNVQNTKSKPTKSKASVQVGKITKSKSSKALGSKSPKSSGQTSKKGRQQKNRKRKVWRRRRPSQKRRRKQRKGRPNKNIKNKKRVPKRGKPSKQTTRQPKPSTTSKQNATDTKTGKHT